MYENKNALTSCVFGFNYCWVKDGGEIYHDRNLTNDFNATYWLQWIWGNDC